MASTEPTAAATASVTDSEDDDYLDDIFEDDTEEQYHADSGDLTKLYNRHRQANEADSGALPRSNPQKPSANTRASIDDQIAALSQHAAKIRLDDVKGEQGRVKDKSDRATTDQVLDSRTRMILYKLINRGDISEVSGAISTGKEANVYNAIARPNGVTEQRAVKVYKTRILTFKDRERYVTGDHRFQKGVKGNSRKMVQMWAEKEYRNLRRIHEAKIPCPEPMVL